VDDLTQKKFRTRGRIVKRTRLAWRHVMKCIRIDTTFIREITS